MLVSSSAVGCFSSSSSGSTGPSFDSGFPDISVCSDCEDSGPGVDASSDAATDVTIPLVDSGLDASPPQEAGPGPFDAAACTDSGTGYCMIVLNQSATNPSSTRVDSARVYWVQESTGSVVAIPIYGGALSTLAVGGGGVFYIAIDATSVYFANEYAGTLLKAPLDGDGGQTVTLATGRSSPAAIAVDGTGVYWADFNGSAILQAPLSGVPEGGAPVTLARSPRLGLDGGFQRSGEYALRGQALSAALPASRSG